MWNDPNDILNQNQSKNLVFDPNQVVAPSPTPVAPPPAPVAPPPPVEFSPLEKEQDITKGSQTATSTTTTPATENISTTTQSKVLPQGFYQAQADYAKATEAQKAAAGAMTNVEIQQANRMATFQDKAAEDARVQAEHRKIIAQDEYDKGIKYLDEVDKKTTELLNKKYEGFWANKAAGTKIVSALAVAAGAYGAALSGTSRNFALDIVQKEMDDDFRNFKENQNQQIQAINNSKLTYESKQKLLSQLDASKDAYQLAQREQIKAKAEALAAKFKAPEAQAKLAALVAAMDKDIAGMNMNIQQGLSTTVSQNIDKRAAQTQTTTSSSTTNNVATKTKSAALQKDATGKLIKPATKEEIKLGEEFMSHPEVKAYNVVATAYDKVQRAGTTKTPSGASDMSLIFGYMKMLDPGSTVREGEYATAQNAGSVPENVRATWNRALNGEKLADTVRKSFLLEAKSNYDAQKATYDRIENQYREKATRYGWDADRAFGPKKPDPFASSTAPNGQESVVQDGITYKWNGSKYE